MLRLPFVPNPGGTITRTNAYRVFFPVASVYGMLLVPASVWSLGAHALLPGLQTPFNHAHELLFGYAMGVVTGFLLNNVPAHWITSLLGLWIAARFSYLLAPDSGLASAANIVYSAAFVLAVTGRLLAAAKKWRNRAFAITLVGFGASVIAAHVLIAVGKRQALYLSAYEGVLMIVLLTLLMGGRIIAPAAAGHIEARGGSLEARVQPRLEAAIILLLLTAACSLIISSGVAGLCMLAGGAVATIRLLRWRLHKCLARTDLVSLGVGYGWVAGGLIIGGGSLLCHGRPTLALHAMTIGGIGTLTLTVMARTWLRNRVRAEHYRDFLAMTSLISVAACLRLATGLAPSHYHMDLLLAAAACWSAAILVLVIRIFLGHPVLPRPIGRTDGTHHFAPRT